VGTCCENKSDIASASMAWFSVTVLAILGAVVIR
jgi:hypothetical protein